MVAGELPAKRPDLDNIVKLYMDAMNGLVFEDDSQIVSLYADKRYSTEEGVIVEIFSHEAVAASGVLDGSR